MSFIVYKITDGIKTYVGSTTLTIPRRKAQHHIYFKDENIKWKLYIYWRTVGWENMNFHVIKTGISDKKELKQNEEEAIRLIEKENCLNTIKAHCPNYEATRSINSGMGEIEKIEKKRKTRRDFYQRHKTNPEWHEKQKARQREKMKQNRTNPEYKQKESERRNAPYICECGIQVTIDGKRKHLKTKKHNQLMEKKQTELNLTNL